MTDLEWVDRFVRERVQAVAGAFTPGKRAFGSYLRWLDGEGAGSQAVSVREFNKRAEAAHGWRRGARSGVRGWRNVRLRRA